MIAPAIGFPSIEDVFWNARVLILRDPFGNHLRISEPSDPADHTHLPRWADPADRDD